MNEFSF